MNRPMFFSLFLFLFSISSVSLSVSVLSKQSITPNRTTSLSFPLTSAHISPSSFSSSLIKQNPNQNSKQSIQSSPYNYRTKFKYSRALFVSLPIGTPPQSQQMLLDTGSQLSWTQCHKKLQTESKNLPPTTTFDPSRSSSFSLLPCNHPLCKPHVPDFTLPTTCDHNRLCHYSYFYADGTLSEGNLVRERFTFSESQITPPLILGCAAESIDDKGILGMNLGRLSFASQSKITKFSYCVPPTGRTLPGYSTTGSFYLGENPNSHGFRYMSLLTFRESQRMPNLDPLAFTLPMEGIRIGFKKLSIPVQTFRPDAGGSGQTMIDSGSELTYLVDEAYDKVKEEIIRLVGPWLKEGRTYGGGVADMCFGGDVARVGRLIGDVVFEFERGVEIVIEKERVLADVGGGIHCVAIGRSSMLGAPSNIIGNVHQQNMWVEYDLVNRRVGLGKADCTRSI